MFLSRWYNKLRSMHSTRKLTLPIMPSAHVCVHGHDPLLHIVDNGDLSLDEFLSSIGMTGEYQIWVDAPDLEDDGPAAQQARQDAIDDGFEPLPNQPIDLDSYGRVSLFTIVDNSTDQLLGDALYLHDQHRWIFEEDIDCLGASAN